MRIGYPQITLIILIGISMGISIIKHGEQRDRHHAGWAFIGVIIELVILYWGGFFD